MKNNKYVLLKENGDVVENPIIEGLKVDFFGAGNTVEIEEGTVFHNCHFKMREGCKIFIAKSHKRGIRNTVIDLAGSYDGFVKIDSGTSIESSRFAMANEKEPYIYRKKLYA